MKFNLNTFLNSLKDNDPSGFKFLYELYFDKLCHVAFSYVRDMQDAEEIVQNVFLKVWERRKSLETLTNSYLYTVTKNACIDFLKKPTLTIVRSENIYDKTLSDPLRFATNDAASDLMEQELERKIQESIAAMPITRREVFLKSRFLGMNNSEIAQEFGISKRTVDTHISLAIRFMRSQLREYLT